MKETIKEKFDSMRREAKRNLDSGIHAVYTISGTTRTKNALMKLVDRYYEDALIDLELGIISLEQAGTIKDVCNIMRDSLERMEVY